MATYTTQQIVEGLITPITLNETTYSILLQKWQNLLYEGIGVAVVDIETDASWPYLSRVLIAYLIVRDLVYNSANNNVMLAAGGSSGGTSLGGSIKKIETGPVNGERHDGASSVAKIYATMFAKDGLWEDILLQICSLANKLGVHISGCSAHITAPLKIIRSSDYSYQNQYPITPATAQRPSE